jgi:outer membrane receptor protein involved in Fe transport
MQNLRFSFTKTIARPSFKEMSFAEILDPITGRTFIGSLLTETTSGGTETLWDGNLVSTDIYNFDLRWELYRSKGQLVSVSGFYKYFRNPIEIVQYLSDPGAFQARNVGDAQVAGAELEIRQNFEFIHSKLENLVWSMNTTYTYSRIQLSESELRSRQFSARDGEEVSNYRSMAGQAPFIVNTGLTYNNPKWKAEGGIFYNVQGETLLFVGFANRTDVYSVPFHNLSLKISKTLGKEDNISLSFKASNLVNDAKEEIFKSYQAEDRIFTRLRPQRTFSLSFGYKF